MSKKQQKQKGQKEEKVQQTQAQEIQVVESVLKAIQIQYCPICTLPFEFCDFGGKLQKCNDWKKKNKPELLSAEGQKKQENNENKQVATQQPQEKKQKGSKAKKYIVYDVTDRTKKKHVTTISGLEGYGISAKDFSKKCSKKFACSCNVVNEDKIQIQGDISQFLAEFMQKQYQVKEKYVVDIDTYKKKVSKLQKKEVKKVEQEKQPQKVETPAKTTTE